MQLENTQKSCRYFPMDIQIKSNGLSKSERKKKHVISEWETIASYSKYAQTFEITLLTVKLLFVVIW